MKVSRIHIIFPGDPSVGIFPTRFELTENSHNGTIPIIFNDTKHLYEFKKGLAEFMEQYLMGYKCYCLTNEEYLNQLDEIPNRRNTKQLWNKQKN